MIRLNLISQELKNEIKLKHLYVFFKRLDYFLLLLAFLISVIFLTSKLIMQNKFNIVIAQTTLITKNSQSYNSKVKEINQAIISADQIQSDFANWSIFINDFAALIDENIHLTYLKISKIDNSIKIRGRADERDSLIKLKKSLEASEKFSEINFPLTNILEKNDIDFEINAKIKP